MTSSSSLLSLIQRGVTLLHRIHLVSLQVHFGFTELFLAGAYFRFAAGSLFTNRFGFHPISGNSTTPVTIYPTCHQYPENPGNLNPIQLATTCSKNRAKNKSRDEVHFPRRHAKKKAPPKNTTKAREREQRRRRRRKAYTTGRTKGKSTSSYPWVLLAVPCWLDVESMGGVFVVERCLTLVSTRCRPSRSGT